MQKRSLWVGILAMMMLIFIGLAVTISSASPDAQIGAQRTPRGGGGAALTAVAGTASALQTNIAGTANALRDTVSGTADAMRTNIAGISTQAVATAQAYQTQAHDRVGTIAPTMTAIRATLDAIPSIVPTQVMAFLEALDGETSMVYDPETGTITVTSTLTESQLNIATDAAATALGADPNSINIDLFAPNGVLITWIDASSGNTYAASYQLGITGNQYSATLTGLTINGRTVPTNQIPPIVATASGVVLDMLNGVFEALNMTYAPQSISTTDTTLTTVVTFTIAP